MTSNHAAAVIITGRALAETDPPRMRLELEQKFLRDEMIGATAFGERIGPSQEQRAVSKHIHLIAFAYSSVPLQGESGTANQLVARRSLSAASRQNDR